MPTSSSITNLWIDPHRISAIRSGSSAGAVEVQEAEKETDDAPECAEAS